MTCGCDQNSLKPVPAEQLSSEPLLVWEPEGGVIGACDVLGCGESCPAPTPTAPRSINVEKYAKNATSGLYEVSERHEVLYEGDAPSCLPWVKISRDPKNFKACLAQARKIGQIRDSQALYDLVHPYMVEQDQEVFLVIMIDTQLLVRGVTELTRGARDRVQTPIPDILRLPIVAGAMAFAVAHNHPSGKPTPSKADDHMTAALKKAGDVIDVRFMDHIVCGVEDGGKPGYYSYAKNKAAGLGKW